MANPALALSNALADAVDRAGKSVVRLDGARRRPATGLVWSNDGLIITAAHCIEREEGIEVHFDSGDSAKATLVGSDPATDIALLRVENNSTPVSRANSKELRRGQLVLALTRPGRSVRCSHGIVSALGEEWRAPGGGRIDRYISSDVALERGISGGPLVDVLGNVIGLNTTGLVRGAAVTLPVETVQRVVESIVVHGRIRRGYLGVNSYPVRLPEATPNTEQGYGLIVVGIQPGGPSEVSGVLLGDVLLKLDEERLESISELQAALEERADRTAKLTLLRAGKVLEVSVTPGTRP